MARHYKIGLLSRRAIEKFKGRQRGSFDHYLDFPEWKLDDMMEALPERPPVWFALTRRQKALFLIGAKLKRFAFFADTGEGKTFLSIALMRYFKKRDISRCNLVLVPNLSNKWEWATEGFDKHAPSVKYVVLDGSSEEKWRMFNENPDAEVFIETYGGLMHMLCDHKEDERKGKRKNANRLVPNPTKVKRMLKRIEGIIADESTFAKSRDALPFRLCQRFALRSEICFVLSATPFGRDPLDIWAQAFLVDQGYALGETLGLFRQTFYIPKKRYWGEGVEWVFNKKMDGLLKEYLRDTSIVLEADPRSLPLLESDRRYCSLGEDAQTFYAKVKEQMKFALGGKFKEMENAFMRARQISSGFVGYRDDASGDRASYVFQEQPKLELLRKYIEHEMDEQHKFIVFHEFNFSGEQLAKLMERLGIGYVLANGKTKDRDVPLIKRAFKQDKRTRAMLLSNSWGGYGLNLQIAKYGLYYEAPVSPIIRRQTQRRFERQHSPHKRVWAVDFIMRGTADETILGYHAEGKALWKSILGLGQHERPEKWGFFDL